MKSLLSALALAATAATLALAPAGPAQARLDVNVNLGFPSVVIAEPPHVVLVPRTQVYFAPDVSADLRFYGGFWWLRDSGHWYRSHQYQGPWQVIERRSVPGPVVRIPRDHRRRYAHERRIPYGQFEQVRERRRSDRGGNDRGRGNGKHRGKGDGNGGGRD